MNLPKPRRKMARPEQKVQRQLVGLLEYCRKAGHLRYFAVPNGGYRTKIEASIMVGQGVKAGVPDIVILMADSRMAFVETKADDGRLSPNQKDWRDWLLENGFPWAEVRDVETLATFLGLLGVPSAFLKAYEAPAWVAR